MGAWGVKTFENDDALDWVFELEQAFNLDIIEKTLENIDAPYLDASDGIAILAAAEVILALQKKGREQIPDEVKEWVANNIFLDSYYLIEDFIPALKKVRSSDSELNQLWQTSDDYTLWLDDVKDLLEKLKECIYQ